MRGRTDAPREVYCSYVVLVVVTDFVEFCGYPLFLAVLADKMKEGKLIHD